eukprot:scaffold1340_cov253-Pinguiococcus_pyrenoidosus.AAC.39
MGCLLSCCVLPRLVHFLDAAQQRPVAPLRKCAVGESLLARLEVANDVLTTTLKDPFLRQQPFHALEGKHRLAPT